MTNIFINSLTIDYNVATLNERHCIDNSENQTFFEVAVCTVRIKLVEIKFEEIIQLSIGYEASFNLINYKNSLLL